MTEDARLFFEAKRGPRAEKFGKRYTAALHRQKFRRSCRNSHTASLLPAKYSNLGSPLNGTSLRLCSADRKNYPSETDESLAHSLYVIPCNSQNDIVIHLFTTKSNKIRQHAGVILTNARAVVLPSRIRNGTGRWRRC